MSDGIEQGQPALWAEGERPSPPPEPQKTEPAPQPSARFQAVNRQQMVWRAVDVEQLLEPDHLARAIWEMSGRLDLTPYTVEVPAVEEVKKQNGRAPGQMIVDEGYTTRENVLAAAERGVDLIGGTMEKDAEAVRQGLKQRGLDPAFYPQNFRYHPETNSYGCPAGKILAYQRTRHDRVGVEHQVYQARAADCRNCAWRAACQPGKQGRRIVRSENVPAVAAYVAKMQTAAARAAYRRRAPVAEFSNLWLKAKLADSGSSACAACRKPIAVLHSRARS